ncbi:Detected protein of unknown function [Hibiscus syriacus]|uniref:Uncharacterized protein n=1 Tax=Hibiscus syriacus TaxID=106335 RepID=A0A6A2ZNW6_HIBSY|nr:Detected protein of unknown function [Hibiscus syriacus]
MGLLDFIFELFDYGGDKSEDGLRGMREEGEEIGGGHERGDPSGSEPQAKQAHGGRLRGSRQGLGTGAHRTGKKVEFWPYVSYDVAPHPYAPGAYDKKAPPGYVRNVVQDPEAGQLARATSFEVKYPLPLVMRTQMLV